ncbi:MAG: InlB B-repeat-containing protein [Treponema sp.]|nr:InlB B-repeat-containing protein [Treponema sp.]
MKTKQTFVNAGGFFMLVLAVFAFTACTNPGASSGEGGEVTVTFETNGGGALAPVTVETGGTIARPQDPAFGFTGAKTRFRGWYTDNETFKEEYVFTSRVLRNITLYADWGYRPGDSGPGGGKIFYRSDAGFTMADDNSTAYYLEAAPRDEGILTWGPPGQGGGGGLPNDVALVGYVNRIGGGRHNTEVILRPGRVPDSPAAGACGSAAHGGRTDWFLPSRDELHELYIQRSLFDNLSTGSTPPTNYWTSNQFDDEFVYAENFNTGVKNTYQNNAFNVRAVRAF